MRMGLKIGISRGKITKAYDGNYTVKDSFKVKSTSLKVDMDQQATYKVTGKINFISSTRWLRADIESGTVEVTYG